MALQSRTIDIWKFWNQSMHTSRFYYSGYAEYFSVFLSDFPEYLRNVSYIETYAPKIIATVLPLDSIQ